MGATETVSIPTSGFAEKRISLFLTINNFETGGSERQFAVLAQHVNAVKFQVHLACLGQRGGMADHLGEIPEFPPGGSLFGWKSVRTRLKLIRHLRKNQVEVAHAFDFYANLMLIPAARLANVPVVIGSHRQLGDLMTPAQFRAQAAVFRWCDAIACNSRAGADFLAKAGVPREKLVVIGNALPGEVFERVAPALPRGAKGRVIMVARMNAEYKGHAGFLRIAAEVLRTAPEAEFLLVGDGPLRPELEHQASILGIAKSVTFLGNRRDIPAILASADVAVLTSNSEGLSNAILEAQAAGLPVVAYKVGGNTELVNDDRGALIPAENEGAFAAAIGRLLVNANLRREQGHNARQFAEENFSLDHVCRQYEDLYARLLEPKRRRKPGA